MMMMMTINDDGVVVGASLLIMITIPNGDVVVTYFEQQHDQMTM